MGDRKKANLCVRLAVLSLCTTKHLNKNDYLVHCHIIDKSDKPLRCIRG